MCPDTVSNCFTAHFGYKEEIHLVHQISKHHTTSLLFSHGFLFLVFLELNLLQVKKMKILHKS